MDSPSSIDLCENDKLKVPDDGSRSPRPSTNEIQKSNMVLRRRMTNTSKKRYTTPSLPKVPHIRTEMASPDRSQENYPNYEIISNHSMVSNASDKSFREKDHPVSRPGSRLFRDCNSPSGLGLPRENTHASLATRSVNSRASIRSNLSAISHLSQTSTQYNNNHRSQSNLANTTQSNNALNRSQTCRTSGNRKIPVFRKTVLRNMANGNLNLSASFNAAADGNLIRSSSLYQRKNLGNNARHQVSKLAQTLSAEKRRFGSTTNTPIIDKRSEMLTQNRPPSFHMNVRQPTLDIGVESTPLTRKNFNFDKLSPISPTASLNNTERTERSKRNWRKALVGIQKLTPEDIEENLQLQNNTQKSNVNNKISKLNRRLSKYANNYKSGTALNSIDINNTGNMATTKDSQKPKLNAAGLREIVNQVIEMQQNTKDKERDLEKSQKWKMKQFASCKKRFGTKLKEPEVLKQISNCQSFGNSHEIADTTYNNFGKQFSVSREKSMDLLDKSLSNNRLNLNVNPFEISASTGANSKNMVRRQKSAHVTQKNDKQGFSGKMSLLKLSKSLRIANRLGNNNNNNTGITSSTEKLDKKADNNSRTEQNFSNNTVALKKDEKRSSVYGKGIGGDDTPRKSGPRKEF